MRTTRAVKLGLAIFLTPASLFASSPGTSGGAILNIPAGARAIGMGEAYTAMADDVSSLYWNPAGIALLNQSQASFMYNQYLEELTYQNASIAVPLENGGIGASLSYLSYGQIEGFDAAGNPAGDVKAYSGVGTVGGAWLGNAWAAGFNLKGIQQSLDDTKANGFAADVGSTFIYPKEVKGGTLRAAFTVRHLGSGIKLIDQTDPFPRQWRVGMAAVQMMNRKLNLSMDYGQERKADGAVYAGSEYWIVPFLALRAGYAGTQAEGSGIRAGIGFKFKGILFDYAYSSFGELGLSHRYELTIMFGAPRPRLTPEERALLRRAKVALAEKRYGEATELCDALIQMVPDYKPVHRMVKIAMAGYEQQEMSANRPMNYSGVQAMRTSPKTSDQDAAETKDLEELLKISDEAVARTQEKKP